MIHDIIDYLKVTVFPIDNSIGEKDRFNLSIRHLGITSKREAISELYKVKPDTIPAKIVVNIVYISGETDLWVSDIQELMD